jgi:hypothetical protein
MNMNQQPVLWNAKTNDVIQFRTEAGFLVTAKVLNSYPGSVHIVAQFGESQISYEKLRELEAVFLPVSI